MSQLPHVHILYENPDWMPPLVGALEEAGFAYTPVEVREGIVGGRPEPGIYLNRMSPSSHTRGHERSVPLMRETLAWLEAHAQSSQGPELRTVNGLRAFELEMSKLRQSMVLEKYGIRTPRTVLAVGAEQLVEVARDFDGPFITKHNRGGKGLGIELFEEAAELEAHMSGEYVDFDFGPHDQVVIQQYIEAADPHITRVEMVGGRMILAMQSATDEGFQLCPSDVCQADLAREQASEQASEQDTNPDNCPVDGSGKFSPSPLEPTDPLVDRYRAMLAGEDIEIAGIEFVEDADGRRYTYDINGTTNYNQALGARIGVDGMAEVARYLREVVAPQMG